MHGEDRTRGPGRYISTLDRGLRHQWEFPRRNRVTNDAQVKTDVDRTSDWRVTHVAALQAELNPLLSLKLSHEVNYRNEPVPGFSRSDTVTSAATSPPSETPAEPRLRPYCRARPIVPISGAHAPRPGFQRPGARNQP